METSPLQLVSVIGTQLGRATRPNKDLIVKSLREAANALSQVQQPAVAEMPSKKSERRLLQTSSRLLTNSIIKHDLLRHSDKDVRLLVGVCVSDIFRILAPDPPFEDQYLRGVFELFIRMFMELGDMTSSYFSKRAKVLETVARCQCCVIMLDVGCNELVVKMFDVFFTVISESHHQSLLRNMLSIMVHILNEETSQPIVDVILRHLIRKGKGSQLAATVIQSCAEKLEPFICGFLVSCFLDRDSVYTELKENYHEILCKVFECAPQMLLAIIPNLTEELLMDQVDVRIKAVDVVGKLISIPSHHFAREYRNVFIEFKNRFSDKSVDVRLSAIQCARTCYTANPSCDVSHELLSAIEGRLLDFDDRVRMLAVVVICDLARSNIKSFPSNVISSAIERLRDKKISVRKKALQKLMELYRHYCEKCPEGNLISWEFFEQIPCKILMLYYDKECKEFRSHNLDAIVTEDLFPTSLSIKDRTIHWIYMFSLFTSLHAKALNTILSQRRRLQVDMQNYLTQRKKEQGNFEEHKKTLNYYFVRIASFFPDPSKCEECLNKVNNIKDEQFFTTLEQLLEEKSFERAQSARDNFFKMMGEKHPCTEFLQALTSRCSFGIFGKEHVHCILDWLLSYESTNDHIYEASTKLLAAIINNFPVLLRGSEELYKDLLKRNTASQILLQPLVKAGQFVTERFSEFYPLLKTCCREGSRIQSKYAVSAMASMSGSSKQRIFSDLCKELVSFLSDGLNIPTLLQSLGCIAQHCVLACEETYDELRLFIFEKLLRVRKVGRCDEFITGECCDRCQLKIYGLKVLVKSFSPYLSADRNEKVHELIDLLTNMLGPEEMFEEVMSCPNDRHHLRLAAAKSLLRLSRQWDMHIPPDAFRFTVLYAKDSSPSVGKMFLEKIFQLLKKRAIPGRFACAFAMAASDSCKELQDAAIHCMEEYLSDCIAHAKVPALCNREAIITEDIAYVVVFLIHVLAHDPTFTVEALQNEQEFKKFLRPLFWVLDILLNSRIANSDIKLKSDRAIYLVRILKAIRKAEDAVDKQITPKLQLLADNGIAFVRSLHNDANSPSNWPAVILLPSSLYRIRPSQDFDQATFNLPTLHGEESLTRKFVTGLDSQCSMNVDRETRHKRKLQEDCIHTTLVASESMKSNSDSMDPSLALIRTQTIGTKELKRKRAVSPSMLEPLTMHNEPIFIDGDKNVMMPEECRCSDSVAMKPCSNESLAGRMKSSEKQVCCSGDFLNVEKHSSQLNVENSEIIDDFLLASKNKVGVSGNTNSRKNNQRVRVGYSFVHDLDDALSIFEDETSQLVEIVEISDDGRKQTKPRKGYSKTSKPKVARRVGGRRRPLGRLQESVAS